MDDRCSAVKLNVVGGETAKVGQILDDALHDIEAHFLRRLALVIPGISRLNGHFLGPHRDIDQHATGPRDAVVHVVPAFG